MLRVLRSIYKKVLSCVLLGDVCTDFFEILVGLRQGCLLSPILFDIFIDELGAVINKLNKGVLCGNRRVSILFFADDVVLIAESKEDLELMLQTVYEFCFKWRLNFNFDKCSVLVFENKKRVIKYGNCKVSCLVDITGILDRI